MDKDQPDRLLPFPAIAEHLSFTRLAKLLDVWRHAFPADHAQHGINRTRPRSINGALEPSSGYQTD